MLFLPAALVLIGVVLAVRGGSSTSRVDGSEDGVSSVRGDGRPLHGEVRPASRASKSLRTPLDPPGPELFSEDWLFWRFAEFLEKPGESEIADMASAAENLGGPGHTRWDFRVQVTDEGIQHVRELIKSEAIEQFLATLEERFPEGKLVRPGGPLIMPLYFRLSHDYVSGDSGFPREVEVGFRHFGAPSTPHWTH